MGGVSGRSVLCFRAHCAAMDNRDITEFIRVLRRHAEQIQFKFTSKVHENEHHCITQHANIMNLLLQQKKGLDIVEAECNMLRTLALNLRKDPLLLASNKKGPASPAMPC